MIIARHVSLIEGSLAFFSSHLSLSTEDDLDSRWEEATREAVDEVIFLSRHTTVSNRTALPVHPIGGVCDFFPQFDSRQPELYHCHGFFTKETGAVVVMAANAGGAWTPIGDVTTTMLWIHGLGVLWVLTDAIHYGESERQKLKIPQVLSFTSIE
ncbi:hypothetical protein Bca101_036075 [Brassica carinata]